MPLTLLPFFLSLLLGVAPTRGWQNPETASSLAENLADFQQQQAAGDFDAAVEALHRLGKIGDKEAVDALLQLLPHLEGKLELAAIHGIALAGTPYANSKLRTLARNRTHPNYRRQACLDLSQGSPDDLKFLRDHRLKKESDLNIRAEILRNLIDHKVDKLDKVVLKAAKSKDNIYAGVGLYGIGKLKLEKGLKTVESYLTDPDLQLRLAAFRALATFGGAACFQTLLHAYAHANNLALQPDILVLLQNAKTVSEVQILIEEGLESENPEVVEAAASALAMAASAQPDLCAPVLVELLQHPSISIRTFAIEGLVRAHPPEVVSQLIAQLGQGSTQTRSTALWALAQLGNLPADFVPQLVLFAQDARAPIRLHAAEGLALFPDSEQAFQTLLQLLSDSQWAVRATAVQALLGFRRTESVPALVRLVEEETGRVRQDAVEALCQLTGEDFGPALHTWKLWWEDMPNDYVLPPLEVAQQRLAKRRARRAKGHDSVATSVYHGIPVPQGGVVFVLDISGSMNSPYNADESYYQHFANALADTIALLQDDVQFNILLFSGGVQTWKEFLAPANAENIDSAQDFLQRTRPDGPTNLYGALMVALGYQNVQTIFLLTDGDPTFGRVVLPKAILAELERINRDRHVVINTIAAGEVRADFLAELAQSNGGEAVDLTSPQKL